MLSIGLFARHGNRGSGVAANGQSIGRRRVLPYVFRRPARMFNRLLAGDLVISKRGWLTLALATAITAGVGIFANTPQGHSIVADLSVKMGFEINKVVIEGTHELSRIDILTRLDQDSEKWGQSKSLFTFDIKKAREDLGKLAWVKDVVVAKSYPDHLIVRITERQPFAVWQEKKTSDANDLMLVERGGKPIDWFDENYSNLPLLVGEGANVHGADILYLVSKVSILENQVKAYARIADRRWDLHLRNGMIVRLPGENPAAALRRLSTLDATHQLLTRDLTIVDLRLGDRLVVALGEEAMHQRADRLENVKSAGKVSRIVSPVVSKKPVEKKI